jgi:hypothetical protein
VLDIVLIISDVELAAVIVVPSTLKRDVIFVVEMVVVVLVVIVVIVVVVVDVVVVVVDLLAIVVVDALVEMDVLDVVVVAFVAVVVVVVVVLGGDAGAILVPSVSRSARPPRCKDGATLSLSLHVVVQHCHFKAF